MADRPCSIKPINEEELLKIYKYVYGYIFAEQREGRPLTIDISKKIAANLYDKIASLTNNNRVSAANYASMVPAVVIDAIHVYKKDGVRTLFNYALDSDFDFNSLNKIVRNISTLQAQDRLDYVEQYTGRVGGSSQKVIDAQQTTNEVEEDREQAEADAVPPTKENTGKLITTSIDYSQIKSDEEEYIATPPTGLRTTGLENIPYTDIPDKRNPVKVFSYQVMRNLVKALQLAENYDSRNIIFHGATDGVYIKFISADQAAKDGLDKLIIPEVSKSPFYAVPVNKTGEYLYFDKRTGENTPVVSIETSPVLFGVPEIKRSAETNTLDYITPGQLKRSIESYMRSQKVTREEASYAVQNDLAVSYGIQQKLLEDPTGEITGYINGGSKGFILYDLKLKNPVKSIVFPEGPQGYRLKADTLNELGKGKGVTFLYSKSTNDYPIAVERPLLSDEVIETVSTLLTAPIINSETNEVIDSLTRRNLVDQFIYRGAELKNFITIHWKRDNLPDFHLTLNGEYTSVNTDEEAAVAKVKIKTILKSNRVKLNILGKAINEGAFDPVSLKVRGTELVYTPSFSNYKIFLEDQGIFVNYRINEEKQLVTLNPYLTFGMEDSEIESLGQYINLKSSSIERIEIPLKEEYVSKFIYATPGSGKSSIIFYNSNLVDADDLLVKQIRQIPGNTRFNVPFSAAENHNIGQFLQSAFDLNPDAANNAYEKVLHEIPALLKQGKTVLTGSHRFIPHADIVLISDDPVNLATALAEKAGDDVSNIPRAVVNIINSQNEAKENTPNKVKLLTKALYDISEDPVLFDVVKPAEVIVEAPPTISEEESEEASDTNPGDYFNDNISPDDLKNLGQKEREIPADIAQIEAAKEWYKTTPLSKYVPFQVIAGAVNLHPTAVAAWSRDGIILSDRADSTDYYHEAFHGFVNTFMTRQQRENLFAATRKIPGSFTNYDGVVTSFSTSSDKELEEFLAEGFRNYMLDPQKYKFNSKEEKSIFEWLWNVLRILFEDVTIDQLTESAKDSSIFINDLYEKLRVGNLTDYSFQAENTTFNRTATGMTALDSANPTYFLDFADSDKIVQSMDSLISEYVDLFPLAATGRLIPAELRAYNKAIDKFYGKMTLSKEEEDIIAKVKKMLGNKKNQDGGFSIGLIKNAEKRSNLYKYVYDRLNDKLEFFIDQFNNGPTINRSITKRKIDLIQWAITNYGDYSFPKENRFTDSFGNVKGVIGYHILNTTQFEQADKEELIANIDVDEDKLYELSSESGRLWDEGGNSVSVVDRADPDLLYLLHSLYQPGKDKSGIPELNDLNIPKLLPFDRLWNNMVRLLEGMDDREDMYKAINHEIINFPGYAQLLGKLGTPKVEVGKPSLAGFNLWNKILQTFSNTHLPLIQTTIKETFETIDGVKGTKPTYTITVGVAQAIYKRVGEIWERNFQESYVDGSTFILKTPDDKRIIDIPRAAKVTLTLKSKPQEFVEFLNNIGLTMDNSDSILYSINKHDSYKRDIIAFLNKIKNIYIYNESSGKEKIVIESTLALVNIEKPDTNIQGLNKAYKNLQQLESKYSDQHSNFMVTNAEGNAQYEHSLNSTLTRIINVLNNSKKYKTYQDVIALKRMRFLDQDSNVFAKASIILDSLFHMDKTDPKYGKRRIYEGTHQPITIDVSSLSGIALVSDDEWEKGIANASSDTQSKLLLELHNFAHLQTLEVMRHSDKKSSFSFGVDYVYANGRIQKTYVSIEDFSRSKNIGFNNGANLIKKHLSAELERINLFKNLKTEGLQYDFDYLERGKNFIIFQDMPDELERKLLAVPSSVSLLEYLKSDPSLDTEVMNYIRDYLKIQSQKVQERINEASFIHMPYALSNKGVDNTSLIDAFVTNSIIHNLESLVIIYGDPAMYNIKKEEFHKRNAGAGGTGTIFATDKAALQYINSPEFNKDGYANILLGAGNVQSGEFDGTLATAVIKDPEIKSAYYDTIADYKEKSYSKKGMSPEEIRVKLYGDGDKENPKGGEMAAYHKMKIADAQGYINFDAYRLLRSSQGRWTTVQERLYKSIINNIPVKISEDKLLEIFPPEKYQYWGQLEVKEGMMPVIAMHKFALIPLVPTVIGSNSTLTQLHEKMLREGIAYSVFQTGSKLGTITDEGRKDQIFSDDESFKISSDFQTKPFTKNTIFLEYLKNQVEIAPYFKGRISFSSQMRKLVEDGLMELGIPTDFQTGLPDDQRITNWNNLIEKEKEDHSDNYKLVKKYETDLKRLTQAKKQELIDEMGIELNPDNTIKRGFENFISFVKRELSRREIGNHAINLIGVNDEGKIKVPLDLSLQADEIEKMLNTIITKRLVKLKVNGEGFIQVSNALFENRDFAFDETRNFKKPTQEELNKYGSIDLPYYNLVTEDGKERVTLAKCKVALSSNFLNLIYLKDKDGETIAVTEVVNENGKQKVRVNYEQSRLKLNVLLKDSEWLDIGDHRRMITLSGPRIPVQGMNSMEAFEVYEFLPEEAGPILIAPAEIVAKSGSDFDKDTLFLMSPNIYKVNNTVKLYSTNVSTSLSNIDLKRKLDKLYKQRETLYKSLFKGKVRDRIEALRPLLTAEELSAVEKLTDDYYEVRNELSDRISLKENGFALVLQKLVSGREAIAITDELYNLYQERDIMDHSYRQSIKQYNLAFSDAKIDDINKEIESNVDQLNSLSSKAFENNVIQDFTTLVTLPSNYESLVRPNDTDLVKPLADDLVDSVTKYNPKEWLFSKSKSGVAGTRILEMEYNLYKHESNNVGKQVLGIGAVDNTYNILFNRIGAYMKPYAYKDLTPAEADRLLNLIDSKEPIPYLDQQKIIKSEMYKQDIYLKHNSLLKDNRQAISLSHVYDANNQNKIGDVISQLINGWVDVAKDAWVFNIQGNKEVSPTLLFMIQAGVPLKEAVYFVSQPLVREYVREQRLAKSAFGKPLNKAPKDPNMFRNQARASILSKYGFLSSTEISSKNLDNFYAQKKEILKIANNFIPETLSRLNLKSFDEQKLYSDISKPLSQVDDHQRAAFMHFLQLEEMSKATTEFKMATNVDTSRTGSVFSAMDRLVKIDKLENSYRLPGVDLVDKIKSSSPISSFFIQDFQLAVVQQLFPIRNSSSMTEFIKTNIPKLRGDLDATFGDNNQEEFWNAFRNNAISFLFQNQLYTFNVQSMSGYKGASLDKELPISKIEASYQRVVVTDIKGKPTIYVDLDGIEQDFNSGRYTRNLAKPVAGKDVVPYAPLSSDTFNELNVQGYAAADFDPSEGTRQKPFVFSKETSVEKNYRLNKAKRDQYAKFVIEREITRYLYPLSKAQQEYDYKLILKSTPPAMPHREITSYETFLRNRALDNIYNPYKMFLMPQSNVAETFLHIKNKFKELSSRYTIFDNLTIDYQRLDARNNNIKNLRLRNTKLTKYDINVYHENLKDLANPAVEKVPNKQDNEFISRFFTRLTYYGYIQSGLNSSGRYSLNKVLPAEGFTDFMTNIVNEYTPYLNQNKSLSFYDLYYPAFIKTETKRIPFRGPARVRSYTSPFSLSLLKTLDKRPEVKERIVPLRYSPEQRLYTNNVGLLMFRPNPNPESLTYKQYYKQLLSDPNNKTIFFVYNTGINDKYKNVHTTSDAVFQGMPDTNKFGIPTWDFLLAGRKYVDIKDSTNASGNSIPNEQLKPLIDQAVADLLKIKQTHLLAWNDQGYGVPLATTAPMTYLYLSQQLAKHFGYANPGIRTSAEGVKALQYHYEVPMTYEEAASLYQKCITG